MSKISIQFTNYKLLEDQILEMEKGFLYIVSGKNNIGKTSMLSGFQSLLTALDATPVPITNGQTEGEIKMINWVGPEGEDVVVTRKMKANEKDSYLMTIDGKKVKEVTKLRKMFGYIPFDATEFVNWSKTQEGRDKQRNIILNLLTLEQKTEFFKFEDRDAELVTKRKASKILLASAVTMKKSATISKEEQKLLDTKEGSTTAIAKLREDIANIDLDKEKKKNLTSFIQQFNTNIEQAKNGLSKDFVIELEKLRKKIEDTKTKELDAIAATDEVTHEENKTRLKNGEEVLKKIQDIETKESKIKDYTKEVTKHTKIVDTDEENLAKCREEKNKFMEGVELPVKNIIIGSREEGLKYNLDGTVYPFDEKQLSKSLIYKITIEIMSNVNSKAGVLVIGDAGHLDSEAKKGIALFAQEKELLIIGDEVTDEEVVSLQIIDSGEVPKVIEETFESESVKVKKDEEKDEQMNLFF